MKVAVESLRRLRDIEAELDSATAESSRLRKQYVDALRPGASLPWPPPTQPQPDDSAKD